MDMHILDAMVSPARPAHQGDKNVVCGLLLSCSRIFRQFVVDNAFAVERDGKPGAVQTHRQHSHDMVRLLGDTGVKRRVMELGQGAQIDEEISDDRRED